MSYYDPTQRREQLYATSRYIANQLTLSYSPQTYDPLREREMNDESMYRSTGGADYSRAILMPSPAPIPDPSVNILL